MPKTIEEIRKDIKGKNDKFTIEMDKVMDKISELLKENYPLCYQRIEIQQILKISDDFNVPNILYAMRKNKKYRIDRPIIGWYQYDKESE